MGKLLSRKQRIALFIPNSRWLSKRPWIMIPYAALIITALLKDRYDFQIIDANADNLGKEQCINRIREFDPSIILISALSVEYHAQYHMAAEIAKEACPEIVTIMGGVYPTTLGEEVLKDYNIDYIFIGHAEERLDVFLDYLISESWGLVCQFPGIGYRDLNGSTIITPTKSYISDVKSHVKPDYSKINVSAYLFHNTKDYQFNSTEPCASIISSYGCPYNCNFCATRTISGRKVVFRPEDHVLEEMEYLMTNFNIRHFTFLDDCILADRKRIISILNSFISRNYNIRWKIATVSAWHLDDELLDLMKEAGCYQLTISVESGSQRVLDNIIRKPLKLEIIPPIVKKCKDVGIHLGANFVIGFPGETWEDIRETFRFAELCNFDLAHFHIATPLPKTDLYKTAEEKNLLPDDFSFTDEKFFGFGRGFITTDQFSPFELHVLRAFEWDRINFSSPEKIASVAKMMNVSIEELNSHRKNTRLNCGIYF